MSKKLSKKSFYGVVIALLMLVLSLVIINANKTNAEQGPDPKTTMSIKKDVVGSGLEKPYGVYLTSENGYNPGYKGINGDILASNDNISYKLSFEVLPGEARKVTFKLVWPEYLEFDKDKSPNVCTSNMFATGASLKVDQDNSTLSCTFNVKAGVAAKFDGQAIFQGKDTAGNLVANQVLNGNIGLGTTANNPTYIPYASASAQPISVISAPMADLMIKPSQCDINGACTPTLNTSTTGSFDLLVNSLKYPGYYNIFGATSLTPWTAQIDVSDFPTGTVWTLTDGTVLDVVDGKINVSSTGGDSKVNFKVPDNNWGGAAFGSGEVRSYDVHLIIPETAFASDYYQNNGNGWQPGQNQAKDIYTQKEIDAGVRKGWYYANNNWTKYVVTSKTKPGSNDIVSKTLFRPWNTSQTLWEPGNMVLSESNLVEVPKDYVACKPLEMCVNEVAAGTEFIAQLNMNGKTINNPQSDVSFVDTWNSDEVDVTAINSIEGNLNVKKIEWLVNNEWQTSNTAITGASAIKVTYDKASFPNSGVVKLNFKVRTDISSSVNAIIDQVSASFKDEDGNQRSHGPVKAQLISTPKPLKKLGLDVGVNPYNLPNSNRQATWTYKPTVGGFLNSKQQVVENPLFTIDLDPAIYTFDLISPQYEIVSRSYGNMDSNTKGKVVVKLKSGNYVSDTSNGVLNMPQISFTSKISMLAKDNIFTSMKFSAYDVEDGLYATNQASVITSDLDSYGAELLALTPKEERETPLKYQYIMVGDTENNEQNTESEAVIIMPTDNDNDNNAYLNELKEKEPSYNGVVSSNYKGTYSVNAEIVSASSVPGTKLMCTTADHPSMDPSQNTWSNLEECNNSTDVTAYKVSIPGGVKESVGMVNFTLNPQGNTENDNYLMWASNIYSSNRTTGEVIKTSIVRPANEVIISSTITGYVYWDTDQQGTVWDDTKDGISNEDYPNLKLQLLDSSNNPVLNAEGNPYITTTDENGKYQFSDVKSGQYKVEIIDGPTVKDSSFYTENGQPKKIQVKPSYVYYNKRGIPINNNENAPTQAENQKGITTSFNVSKQQDFGIVGFGYFGPDPYTNIMKKPSQVECVGDALQCDIQWDIFIKGGTSKVVPGSIKLMYVQSDVNTVVVTNTNQVYIWGVDLKEFNLGADSSQTPLKLDTSAIGKDEVITQVTGSYETYWYNGEYHPLSSSTLMILTDSDKGQNVYALGNGSNGGTAYNKFGTGDQSSYASLTKITNLGGLQDIINKYGGIKTIQTSSFVSVILTNNGEVFETGQSGTFASNTNGTNLKVWTAMKIVDASGTRIYPMIDKIVVSIWTHVQNEWGYYSNNMNNTITAIDKDDRLYTAGKSLYDWQNQPGGTYANGAGKALTALTQTDYVSGIKDFRNYYDSSMAIDGNGNIYVWGKNQYGMLGNNKTDGLQDEILKLNVTFKAAKFLTSNNNLYNTCNVVEATTGDVYATGQCVLPGGEKVDSKEFEKINFDYSNYENFIARPNNDLALSEDGILLPYGTASDNSYMHSDGSYYPTKLPTKTEDGTKFVNGPWIDDDGSIIGEAGSVDIAGLVLNDTVSSQVYQTTAQLYSMKSTEINPTETDLGIISPNATNTLENNFTSRTYNLPNLQKDYMYKLVFSGKVNKTNVGQVIGNQAWITSNEIPRVTPSLNSLPAYSDSDPLAYGKWTGNDQNDNACGVNTDWSVNPDVQNNCDQVFASVGPSPTPLGSLGGIAFWDKNSDGEFNNNDIKLANVPVYLLQVDAEGNGSMINNTVTDDNGSYLFDGLDPSLQYQVSFQLPNQKPGDIDPSFKDSNSGWSFTTQLNDTCSTENESCVNSDGLTPNNLNVVAKAAVGDNTVNAGVVTIAPKISVTKGTMVDGVLKQGISAVYNTEYTVTVNVTNSGDEALQSFIFNDQTNNGQNVTWNSCQIEGATSSIDISGNNTGNNYQVNLPENASLPINKSMTCTGTLPGLQSYQDNHNDTVNVIGFGKDTGNQVNDSSDFSAIIDESTIPEASLTLEKGILKDNAIDSSKQLLDIDKNYTITFRIINNGPQDIINPTLNDVTNKGPAISDIACSFDLYKLDDDTIVNIIKSGQSSDCTGSLNLNAGGLEHQNTAVVNGQGLLDGKTATSNEAVFEASTPIEVTPEAPEMENNVECGNEPGLVIPDQDGVKYTYEKVDGKYIVDATPEEGYVFTADAVTHWEFDIVVEDCPIGITPTAPSLNKDVPCGEDYKLAIPEVEGIDYTTTWNGKEATITATAQSGFEIMSGAQTVWTLNTENETACAIIAEPTLDKDVPCGEDYKVIVPEESTSVKYEVTTNGKIVTVEAIAKEGYGFEPNVTTKWTFNIENDTLCAIVEEPILDTNVDCEVDYKVIVPKNSASVTYEVTTNGKIVTVKAIANDGYAFGTNVKTEWTFNIENPNKCDVDITPVAPTLDTNVECGVDYKVVIPQNVEGIEYTTTWNGKIATVTATAKPGYTIKDGAQTEWTFNTENPNKCDVEVEPIAPTLDKDVECDFDYKLIIPEVEGIEYTTTWNGKIATVIATAKPGYTIKDGAQTEWTFNTENPSKCDVEVEPIAPTLDKDVECEVDYKVVIPQNVEGIEYTTKWNGKIATVIATAKDGYVIKAGSTTTWTFDVTNNNAGCEVADVYKITYVLYGGKNNASNPATYTAGQGVKEFKTPTLPNGVFIKWYMLKDDIMKARDSRVSFEDLEEVTGLGKQQTGNVTIYARWFVTALSPELDTKDSGCEVDYKVIIPKQEGIKYTTSQKDKIIKVKANIEKEYKEGYVFADGATIEWTFDVTNLEKCPVGPEKPGTSGPTEGLKPLPGTGSELMVLGLSLISVTGLGLVTYRRMLSK